MIRRDWPLAAGEPRRWLLISQPDHARLSVELADAWGGERLEPLVAPADKASHPLASVRREFLEAVEHHDIGWVDWRDHPRIDPEHGRPYSFTEMPAADAQAIWSDSIAGCRAYGPLAGWLVAGHFSALQSRRDRDYNEWVDWLAEVESLRSGWLAEWLAADERHTVGLAERCLAWLRAFDWMSLWLCCVCPFAPEDAPCEPLRLGGGETGWPEVVFTPDAAPTPDGERVLRVTPWPFATPELRVTVNAWSIPIARYRQTDPNTPDECEFLDTYESIDRTWRFVPG